MTMLTLFQNSRYMETQSVDITRVDPYFDDCILCIAVGCGLKQQIEKGTPWIKRPIWRVRQGGFYCKGILYDIILAN